MKNESELDIQLMNEKIMNVEMNECMYKIYRYLMRWKQKQYPSKREETTEEYDEALTMVLVWFE